ncbi:MAG: signal peptidase II [Patescibacteria group bacterium]|nr:signal peptidase II [Patescibacteria group bacterium]
MLNSRPVFKNKYFIFIIIFFTFLLDRLIKLMIIKKESFFIIQDFLKINYYANWGIALSLPVSQYIIYPLVVLIMLIIFYYFYLSLKKNNYLMIWSFGLIFVGAFSNLLDRFRFGHVIDYVNFVGRFPVFNLADVMIVCGIFLFLVNEINKNRRKKIYKKT